MTYWIREFLNIETLQRFRVYNEMQELLASARRLLKSKKIPDGQTTQSTSTSSTTILSTTEVAR